MVYVSYQTLENLGSNNGINHYEIVLPNPISNFAENLVREHIGIDEKEVEIIENSSRYSFGNRMKILAAFGTRSMNGKAIIYPFWENVARGYEDMIAVLTLFVLLFLIYPIVLIVVIFIIWWRHKGWTLKDKGIVLKDKWERYLEKRRARKLENEEDE